MIPTPLFVLRTRRCICGRGGSKPHDIAGCSRILQSIAGYRKMLEDASGYGKIHNVQFGDVQPAHCVSWSTQCDRIVHGFITINPQAAHCVSCAIVGGTGAAGRMGIGGMMTHIGNRTGNVQTGSAHGGEPLWTPQDGGAGDAHAGAEHCWKRFGWRVLAALALGALIGVGAGLLTLLLYGVEHMMLGYVEGLAAPGPFAVPAVRRAISVTVGLSVAGVIWWLLRTKTARVPSVKQAVSGERMPWWQTIVHVCLQIVIVGSGASIGREVAPRELGAMLAQRFADVFHLHDADRHVVVAVAAGAGLGGVYDAPLAGMFFAVEILLADVAIDNVAFGLGMSATAAFVATEIKGRHVFYDISAIHGDVTPTLMLAALLIGAACGVVGAWFRRGSQWAESHKPKGATILWQMPIAGLLTGAVALFVPQVMGNGRAAAQLGFATVITDAGASAVPGVSGNASSAASSPWTLLAAGQGAGTSGVSPLNAGSSLTQSNFWLIMAVLAVTFAAKATITLLTIRSGASGGVLQPGIALGSTLGAMIGICWMMVFPADSVIACALIGAAALLSASQQAPLMAMCLVLELTAAPSICYVPVAFGVAVSCMVSRQIMRSAAKRTLTSAS